MRAKEMPSQGRVTVAMPVKASVPTPPRHPLSEVLESRAGSIVVSAIFGLGLAALFRKVCDGRRCVVVQGPDREDLDRYHYRIDGDCFKYTTETVPCPKH